MRCLKVMSTSKTKQAIVQADRRRRELQLCGQFGGDGITAERVRDELDRLGGDRTILIRLDSSGGLLHEAISVRDVLLEQADIHIHVCGQASSAALVLLGNFATTGAPSSVFAFHRPSFVGGIAPSDALDHEIIESAEREFIDSLTPRVSIGRAGLRGLMERQAILSATQALSIALISKITNHTPRLRTRTVRSRMTVFLEGSST